MQARIEWAISGFLAKLQGDVKSGLEDVSYLPKFLSSMPVVILADLRASI